VFKYAEAWKQIVSLMSRTFLEGPGEGEGEMRPTRIELATFGLKDRRSLPLVKAALTTELRARASRTLTSARLVGASRGLGRAIATALAD
jgi:hypothetical protein